MELFYLDNKKPFIKLSSDRRIFTPNNDKINDDIIIKNKGLLGGNLNARLNFQNITLQDWKKISEKKRNKMITILKKMYI